jgi:hypothetical protein
MLRADEQLLTEPDRIRRWRVATLRRDGLSKGLAIRVAESRVDVHEFEALLKAGCPAELAWKILG